MARRREAEQGAATAELALGLPLLLALTVVLVWCLSLAATQVRVIDASREAARALARGDDEALAVRTARRIASRNAVVRVTRDGEQVEVTTSVRVAGPGGLAAWPAVTLTSRAVALEEQ
ncbi:MAG: pilus assembly protein [Nocardioides sp.]|nr:pilus assembly protein [Nocardioides sp.]